MSRIRANTITNKAATGAPTFSNGAVVTGVCTATTFSGSGASLTSLPAGNLTGALPAISGANLTGISNATIGSVISLTSGSNTAGVSLDTISTTTKTIEVFILGMSLSGNSEFKFQLRNASGTVSSGYVGSGGYVSNASYMNENDSSTGFDTYGLGSASYSWSAHLKLKNYNSDYWFMNGDLWADDASTHYWLHGHVNLAAQITGVRFDSTGSGTFDEGELRVNQYSTP